MAGEAISVRDWLNQLIEHEDDERWLNQHEPDLLTAVNEGLPSNPSFHDALEILIRAFPYFALVRYHVENWSEPLINALIQAQGLGDNALQIRIFTRLGETYLTKGKNTAAHDAFEIALERARDEQFHEMMLAGYIGLIRLQSVNLTETYDHRLIDKALALNNRIDDLSLKAALHQAITLALVNARHIPEAIGHGQTAYGYWSRLGNAVETAKTAYLLSAALRLAERLDDAERWLSIAAEQFEKTSYNRQYTLVAYEQGVLHLVREDYEPAKQWLTVALQEAIQVKSTYHIASTHHALGIAQTCLGEFTAADQHLKQALVYWEELKDSFELANCYHAVGYLEKQRGNLPEALAWFDKALKQCAKIPDPTQRAWLEQRINDTLDED